MGPFYLAVSTLVHGLFTSMVLLVLADVGSPTFNVEGIPAWTGSQAAFVFVTVLTVSFALGVVMHTISRGLLHMQKGRWTLEILASRAMRNRVAALGGVDPSRGGPTYAEVLEEDEDPHKRVLKGSCVHARRGVPGDGPCTPRLRHDPDLSRTVSDGPRVHSPVGHPGPHPPLLGSRHRPRRCRVDRAPSRLSALRRSW